jgi:hypothetical protein
VRTLARILAVLAIGLIASCTSGDGSAGPLGPQPQSRPGRGFEVWLTPHPTPFGTAGVTGVPPRPSFAARLAHPTPLYIGGRSPSPSPGARWTSREIADAAIADFRPELPSEAQVVETFQRPGATCAYVFRDADVVDVEATYVEVRRAILAAGYRVNSEIDRRHDGAYGEVLRAETPAVDVRVFTGVHPNAVVSTTAHSWLVHLEFKQRCE